MKKDVPDTNAGDLISRQKAIKAILGEPPEVNYPIYYAEKIRGLPSVQPTTLTEDDKEAIRIHLSAFKERLCNQRRWNEAKEYEELISRLLSTPSAQPRKGKWIITSTFDDCYYAKCDQCHETQVFYYNKPLTNFCPNCGCRMEEGDSDEKD